MNSPRKLKQQWQHGEHILKVSWSWSSTKGTKVNIHTSPSECKVIETRYVWGPDIQSCMEHAQAICQYGRWWIEGNPAPMTVQGKSGTGVSICRVNEA